ncbi:hypothetical protein A2446_03380 [Candidatus Roizmanbacteria bacterium RIFOXYC2_FULL_38_9]|nr:MAG: hypothetical protein A2359_02190 [Candidatus Moranbacteria bacterium RIFOXYB1_FULL_43_19]OGI33329.1 MAG: hypothetical protein A2420_03470 [Candidatus Moranbacteria bacterium RIFOXYC1_FULL_44_13]OGI37513.1 MAG: hypothetical protein A2612_05240 [Candidatus Moranbacteria bacterium RIFOXYD1_FULL_44_12]OGK74556.1 MAG: hypothetical protein A2446_03380 [Candidatus Roizmanbacteria bacterium RIFOXYC2_FULL_38_9]
MQDMSSGQQLEKNLANIMRNIFTSLYWPNRSGLQNGYDAYANFKIKGKEYLWKFECKDYNRLKHNKDYRNISEIEFSDFSDKILEIMSMGNSYYPDVFCIFIPHKRYKSNTVFFERLTSLNVINKFPFKIVLWDFDFLKDKIPHLNISDADDIFPNASSVDKSKHGEIVLKIENELEKESVDGYLHKRSYIRERDAKHSLLVDDVLHIKIEKISSDDPSNPPQFSFSTNSHQFIFYANDLSALSINAYPYIDASVKNDDLKIKLNPEVETVRKVTIAEKKIFDINEYRKIIDRKKASLIELFKINTDMQCLFNIIKDFCLSHPQGIVSFLCPSDNLLLASLPIKELAALDFESNNAIHFYFEFK